MVQTLESGREAISRRAWKEAWETLVEVDREASLSPQDLELMADAAWWAGHPDDALDALERAYIGYLEADMVVEAASVAVLLAYFAMR
ncbi:MAG TPA: hypothetical protein VK990_08540, partial [Acidimicrobiia bacterium]|nr:hypothetical protein [Acidimicrobiia bacterium]